MYVCLYSKCTYVYVPDVHLHVCMSMYIALWGGVAMVSRIDKIIGLFYKTSSLL